MPRHLMINAQNPWYYNKAWLCAVKRALIRTPVLIDSELFGSLLYCTMVVVAVSLQGVCSCQSVWLPQFTALNIKMSKNYQDHGLPRCLLSKICVNLSPLPLYETCHVTGHALTRWLVRPCVYWTQGCVLRRHVHVAWVSATKWTELGSSV